MTDNGVFEMRCQWVEQQGQADMLSRMNLGMVVSRTERRYGAGTIEKMANQTRRGRSSLYEAAALWRFVRRWLGLSARRKLLALPLTYKQIRNTLRVASDYEDAIDWLMQAAGMVPLHEVDVFIAGQGWAPPLTEDQYDLFLSHKAGKRIGGRPFFHKSGEFWQVMNLIQEEMQRNPSSRVRIKVWLEDAK